MSAVSPRLKGIKHWFVAHCQSAREASASQHLEAQQFEVYLPKVWGTVRKEGLQCKVPMPLFPCYLFVRFDPAKQSGSAIRCTKGVVGLVKFGDFPAVVPDAVIGALKEGEGKDGIHLNEDAVFHMGEAVRIVGGPFAGAVATVAGENQSNGSSVYVLMELLSRVNRLNVSKKFLEHV